MLDLRCWAKRARDGAYCHEQEGHNHDCKPAGERWGIGNFSRNDFAPDAGIVGRETAARRIWELHTRLDLITFDAGEEPDDSLREIALRLMRNNKSARADLERIEAADLGSDAAREIFARAADILRPWGRTR